MNHANDGFRYHADGDETDGLDRSEPRRPAPGKITLTQRLAAVRNRVLTTPMEDGRGFLAEPVQRKAVLACHEDRSRCISSER
jgi:hypothetical protein